MRFNKYKFLAALSFLIVCVFSTAAFAGHSWLQVGCLNAGQKQAGTIGKVKDLNGTDITTGNTIGFFYIGPNNIVEGPGSLGAPGFTLDDKEEMKGTVGINQALGGSMSNGQFFYSIQDMAATTAKNYYTRVYDGKGYFGESQVVTSQYSPLVAPAIAFGLSDFYCDFKIGDKPNTYNPISAAPSAQIDFNSNYSAPAYNATIKWNNVHQARYWEVYGAEKGKSPAKINPALIFSNDTYKGLAYSTITAHQIAESKTQLTTSWSGLKEKTTYSGYVIASNSYGQSAQFPFEFTTKAFPDPYPPETIKDLRIEYDTKQMAGPFNVKLKFTASEDKYLISGQAPGTKVALDYEVKMRKTDPILEMDRAPIKYEDFDKVAEDPSKFGSNVTVTMPPRNTDIQDPKNPWKPGNEMSIEIKGIQNPSLYYFAVKAIEDSATKEKSAISNLVAAALGSGGGSGAIAYNLDITTADLGKTVTLTWNSSVAECKLETATDLEFKNIIDIKTVKETQAGSYTETLDGIKDIDKTPIKFFRVVPVAGTVAPSAVVGAVAIKLNQVNAISFPFHTVKGITDAAEPVEALKNSVDKQAEENKSKSRVTSIGIFEGGQHKGWVAADKTTVGNKPSIVGLGTPIQITLGNSDGATETVPFIMVGKR